MFLPCSTSQKLHKYRLLYSFVYFSAVVNLYCNKSEPLLTNFKKYCFGTVFQILNQIPKLWVGFAKNINTTVTEQVFECENHHSLHM